MESNSNKYTVCQYCSGTYQDPRILSCLHSYCLQCITEIHIKDTVSITCPICCHPTPLPAGGLVSFPSNIQLSEESHREHIFQKMKSSSHLPCDSCQEENSVSLAYCFSTECNDFLCKECWDAHRRTKLPRSHTVLPLEEAKKRSKKELVKMLNFSSDLHSNCSEQGMSLSIYCKQCRVQVCDKCLISHHKGHPIHEISEEVKDRKKEIMQCVTQFICNQEELTKAIKSTEEMQEKVRTCKSEVDEMIQKVFANLRQLVQEREKVLLAENSKIAQAKNSRVCFKLESFHHLLDSISRCHALSSAATTEYSDVQFLSIAKTLQDRAVCLQRQFTDTALHLSETPDISSTFAGNELSSLLSSFGSVSEKVEVDNSVVVVIPRKQVGIGATMRVIVILKCMSGNTLSSGRESIIKAVLSTTKAKLAECPVVNNGDGMYVILLTFQQLGLNELCITLNSQQVQGSPFLFNVIPQRDYTKVIVAFNTVVDVPDPRYIAIADSGDLFVTSSNKHCIYHLDSKGKKKNIIGSKGNGELQFKSPRGITVNDDVVYVAEWEGKRIHKLSTRGEFLGIIEPEAGSFHRPHDVKISPDGKIFVVDKEKDCIKVLNPDFSVSHCIDGRVSGDGNFSVPIGIDFDLLGNVHISCNSSHFVAVFTLFGQFVCRYKQQIDLPVGVTIDPSGFSIVRDYARHSLSIFDPCGKFVNSIGGFNNSYGTAVAADGSLWVADKDNNRLVKI